MKKCFALLLAALLCLSLAACGEKAPEDDGGDEQQENNNQQAPTLEELLCTGEWYYVGLKTPAGLVFDDDGTVGAGTWTLSGTTLDCDWVGFTTRFEIREMNGVYFMTDEEGLTLYHSGKKPDWDAFGRMPVQVVTANWEEYLEVVFHEETLEYRLQLKKQYMQALYTHGNSRLDISYSQGERQNVQDNLSFSGSVYWISVENPAEVPLEILGVNGTLEILTDLM